MSAEPTVCGVMLTSDRPKMAQRAVRCWRAQTYACNLLILDSSRDESKELLCGFDVGKIFAPGLHGKPHGELCNVVCKSAIDQYGCDIIAHWDDDDWSHPKRIEEQVALLLASGKQCVGYNAMLFFNTVPGQFAGAWLYDSHTPPHCMGTSMMYWASAWRAQHFDGNLRKGSDTMWQAGIPRTAVSSLHADGDPRMIASLHGGNISSKIVLPEKARPGRGPLVNCWRRAPEWDKRVWEIMAL